MRTTLFGRDACHRVRRRLVRCTGLLVLVTLILHALPGSAATPDVGTALQRALYEEEANQDLPAAIKGYRAVLTAHDEERKLAATALFRLGECYRKLGQTNDATAQYQRLLRDFSDQSNLARLSEQNLAAFASAKGSPSFASRLAANSGEPAKGGSNPPLDSPSAPTDEEEKEIRRIQALIKDSPDLINARKVQVGGKETPKYGAPLHRAAQQGQLLVARFLLDHGAEVDVRDDYIQTPLHWAAISGHKTMAELLLTRGAAVDAKVGSGENSGSTSLSLAIKNDYPSVWELLLARGASVNPDGPTNLSRPLSMAVKRESQLLAQLLIDKGANFEPRDGSGHGLLHEAVHSLSMVKLLLTNKANVNLQDWDGRTLLHLACREGRNGSLEMVELLLAHGADPNLALNDKVQSPSQFREPGWPGTTPLGYAVSRGDLAVAKALLEHKANPNVSWQPAGQPREPLLLFKAILLGQEKRLDMVRLLLDHGADVNARCHNDSLTPLAFVAQFLPDSALPIVELLLLHKAEVNAPGPDDNTPLFWAVRHRRKAILQLLLDHGADVAAVNTQGITPLAMILGQQSMGHALEPWSPAASGRSLPAIAPTRLAPAPAPGTDAKGESAATREIIDLLRSKGARDDMWRDRDIFVSRNGADPRWIFRSGTNSPNHFTLLEVLARLYTSYTISDPRLGGSLRSMVWADRYPFPDVERIRIDRFNPATRERDELKVRYLQNDCGWDIPLRRGDVIELPELDHVVSEAPRGLDKEDLIVLNKCLARSVRVRIKGDTALFVLRPTDTTPAPGARVLSTMENFWLRTFLRSSKLLRVSSDLTRVRVSRTDPMTKAAIVLEVNAEPDQATEDLWLRDGDLIEVPDK